MNAIDWADVRERAEKTFVQAAVLAGGSFIAIGNVDPFRTAALTVVIAGAAAAMSVVWNAVEDVLKARAEG